MVSPGQLQVSRRGEVVNALPDGQRLNGVHGACPESISLPLPQRRRALIANWPVKSNAASPPSHRPFDERQLSMMRDHILERKKSDKQCNQKRRYRDFLRI